jgi:hypothetical protein
MRRACRAGARTGGLDSRCAKRRGTFSGLISSQYLGRPVIPSVHRHARAGERSLPRTPPPSASLRSRSRNRRVRPAAPPATWPARNRRHSPNPGAHASIRFGQSEIVGPSLRAVLGLIQSFIPYTSRSVGTIHDTSDSASTPTDAGKPGKHRPCRMCSTNVNRCTTRGRVC